ncbi:16S rRNA (guanine(527)-N(7))-methyltransferase RsmG [Roseobacter sp. OBYS 0001]|uniref:16S rRNA (guanine(527)-N(7))-methyltransferase RsmG n=1 Tax=Roseobacter sp. OBYS 0001 TaxID=882651 RepID=UPI001BC4411F|nr:16S rRNA (guanine(527)-N(7))-methyltransferase RsmG [Roseobacter sp. OBYS 0001]GIT86312.1 ribosomal RNA small subunit methyltransferase G [Roseobacter sp. OBYS 0001]
MSMGMDASTVSRETLDALRAYYELLLKWNSRINLVSKSSIDDVWQRHIWDSAQIVDYAEDVKTWVDLGSGGGLPGLVVAIMAKDADPNWKTILVESDQRKAAFLRTVIRELSLNARVIVDRIETVAPLRADVVSARALADLSVLLSFAHRHLSPQGTALFMKGQSWEKEVSSAQETWSFDLKAHKSKTSPTAAILEIKEIQRV